MGDLKNLRWPLIAASLLMTVAILWGVSWGLRATTQDSPLHAFLKSQPAVAAFKVERDGGQRVAKVQLKPVDDLGETYRSLEEGMERIVGPNQIRLQVEDRRTPQLKEAFYRINPVIHEAMFTGRFANLVDEVESRAAHLGVERARVQIDDKNVYLQLHRGSDYLYAVQRRPGTAPAAAANSGSGNGGWSF